MLTASRYRFYWVNFGIPLACAVVVFLLFDMTKIDIAFSDLFYDPATRLFPLQHVHLFEKITHKWARIIPNWTGEVAMIGALLSFLWPRLKAEKHSKIIAFLEKSKSRRCFGLPVNTVGTSCMWCSRFPSALALSITSRATPACIARSKRLSTPGKSNTRSGTRISIC